MKKKLRISPEPGTVIANFTILDSTSFSVNHRSGNRIKPKAVWLVKCVCGKELKVLSNNILTGKSKSCGCLRKKTMESTIKNFFSSYKNDAKRRDYSFDLTLDQFKLIIKKPCYYCKKEPSTRVSNYSKMKIEVNGVDRINNDYGYSMQNCVAACSSCNLMKGAMSFHDFMEKINTISNRSCGNDFNTRTTYVTEANVGDTTKVLLLCIYDLSHKFNLQKAEIKALFNTVLDEHIEEIDELTGEIS